MIGDHLPLAIVGRRAGNPRPQLADLLEVLKRALAVDRSRIGGHGGAGLQGTEPGGKGTEEAYGGQNDRYANDESSHKPLSPPACRVAVKFHRGLSYGQRCLVLPGRSSFG